MLLNSRVLATGVFLFPAVIAMTACNPTSMMSLREGAYTCGPTSGTDTDHMVVLTDRRGNRIDIFAMVANGEVVSLDLGPYGEVSDRVDGLTRQSNSRFNVRIVSKKGGNGKFFTSGNPVDDAGWGNWLLCTHDG